MVAIPDEYRDLLERPITCALATIMPDGQPQVTPVWFDYDGEYFQVNTARKRQKDRNMTRNAKVTLLILDPKDDHHWIEVRGHIADISEEGADDVIGELSKRYTGKPFRKNPPDQIRVTYKIAADRINGE